MTTDLPGRKGQAPGPPPVADAIPPPANLDPPGLAAPPGPAVTANAGPASLNGTYTGQGYLTEDPGGQLGCPRTIPVSGLTVSNNYVQFGGFSGPIGANGSVQLPYGRSWIIGTFSGGRFRGNLEQPFPGCRYALDLALTSQTAPGSARP